MHQDQVAADRVWGAAYHIPQSKVSEVRDYLDIREMNGYSIQHAKFHPAEQGQPELECLVYVGLPSNPQFLGAQEPDDLAQHIARSAGPSGRNSEYLLMLEQSLHELAPDSADSHVTDLAARLRRLEGKTSDAVVQPLGL